jgi:hypothetical protein
LAALGCQEELTAPGSCPTLCPNGVPSVIDTVLTPIPGGDSAFVGYVRPGEGGGLLVSNQLSALDARAVLRFVGRGDSVLVLDTLRAFTIDSVVLTFGVLARDSTVGNLSLELYRLPATVDSNITLAEVDAAFIPANSIGTIAIGDSVLSAPSRLGIVF